MYSFDNRKCGSQQDLDGRLLNGPYVEDEIQPRTKRARTQRSLQAAFWSNLSSVMWSFAACNLVAQASDFAPPSPKFANESTVVVEARFYTDAELTCDE